MTATLVSAAATPAKQAAARPPRRPRLASGQLPDSVARLLAAGGTTPIVSAFQSSV